MNLTGRSMTPEAKAACPDVAMRNLISLQDLSNEELHSLVLRGCEHAKTRGHSAKSLEDKVVGVYFRRTSTRTRTAFTVGALRLGAQVISYGPADLQENTGEAGQDTAHVLSSMLDALVARTAESTEELRTLGAHPSMAVVNAMSEEEHPTQALADLTTIHQTFGRVKDVSVLYVGEGNNTATALALALARYPGVRLHFCTPRRYGMPPGTLAAAQALAATSGAKVSQVHDLEELPERVDVVYTTRWETTGTVKEDPRWRSDFEPFQINAGLMSRFPGALFMHDLPAHRGDEVTADVLDGPRSIAFKQAANKLHSAMAVLEWSLGRAEASVWPSRCAVRA